MNDLVEYLRFKLWARLRIDRFNSYHLSHSQFGEDMVLRSMLSGLRSGTYVDIGAHHPVFYSNTYHFYRNGWSGLNVDAIPGSMRLFQILRKRDVNIEAVLGETAGQRVQFFMFDQPALNTTSETLAQQHQSRGVRLKSVHECTTVTINQLIDRHLPARSIDLLCIDIEGMDEPILRSLDWMKHRPRVIVAEDESNDLAASLSSPIASLLIAQGYRITGKAGWSIIATDARRSS
jgi:FkbM family methyltransferase